MCACVLKKAVSEVRKLINDRDYEPCRGVLETSSKVTLKRLVLRKKRRNFFSLLLKGPYRYKVEDMSLGDDGVLIASGEPGGDAATAAGPSLLNDNALFSANFLGKYRLNSVTATASSAQIATLDDSVKLEARMKTSDSTSTSLSYLNVSRIEGTNLERLINELHNKWRFNKEHRLWKHITGQDTLELCFISSIVSTEKELTLRCKHSASGGFTAFLEKLSELTLDVSTSSSHYLVIPAGSAFAYKVQQLEIDPSSGRITIPPGKMATPDGDDKSIGPDIDPDTEISDCRRYYSEFFGRLSIEKQDSLRRAIIKHFSSTAAVPVCETLGETQEYRKMESNGSSNCVSLPAGDVTYKGRQCLVGLKKMAKAALPTDAEPKEKEIADLLLALGEPRLLDLPKERSAVYGIRYFVTALLQLSPDMLSQLCGSVFTNGDGVQFVSRLERLIESKADGTEFEVMESFSLDTAMDDELFLHAWRAAYVAAIHMFGLPVAGTRG